MIVRARRLRKTRRFRTCDACSRGLYADCVAIVGKAERSDKAIYTLWMHEACISDDVRAVLK